MRILILGNNYSSKKFYKLFEQNQEDIIFSNIPNTKNFIDFSNIQDIIDFCEANEINFVLITDEDFINSGLQEILTEENITAFAPSIEAISITTSKASAKKFMYKNKIQTPKFAIMEKMPIALDYIKNSPNVLAIKPDYHNDFETTNFCETFSQGEKIVQNLFSTGNKKIILEDYIEGKNFSAWIISDGYNAKIIGTSAKYQNDIALFEPDFITDGLKQIIQNDFVMPTIQNLSAQDEEYIGILGFDFILTYDNQLFLVGYNSFFDDINVDFFTQGFELNWIQVFESCIIGDVFLKYNFEPKNEYMLTIRHNNKINFVNSKTKNSLINYLEELNYDTNLYKEAQKIWKY
ncbi:MAG: hypothetical protein IJ003_04170 [Candidatus Gastranaerophilales bacterium]|nr:hypothetical protein [Candidatus Gastranaerophilales bacterium]